MDIFEQILSVEKSCEHCGKNFLVLKSKMQTRFCTDACRWEAYMVELVCDQCGKTFRTKKRGTSFTAKSRFCSRSCKSKNILSRPENMTAMNDARRAFFDDPAKKAEWEKKNNSRVRKGPTLVEVLCSGCKKVFETKKRGKTTRKYCSLRCAASDIQSRPEQKEIHSKVMQNFWERLTPEEVLKQKSLLKKDLIDKVCEFCKKPFKIKPQGKVSEKRRFCSKRCAYADPSHAASISKALTGKKSPSSSIRMKLRNPTAMPGVLEKISKAMQGRTFLARGGNGQLTEPQKLLAQHLGLPMEFSILTAPVKGMFPSLPPVYKVDLADPSTLTAIEVDGNSHKTRKWKFLDKRKTEILNALGWSVLRFWNEEVVNDLTGTLEKIRQHLTSKSKTTTTILPTES